MRACCARVARALLSRVAVARCCRALLSRVAFRENFLYEFKGGSLRSPPAPGCGRPQAAVLAGRH
jgi:hypothetical protein